MKKENEDMEGLFGSLSGQWDTEEPLLGHQQRFMDKLAKPKKKFPYMAVLAVAASVIVILGVFITYQQPFSAKPAVAKLSPEAKETQVYFNTIIRQELASLSRENDPESKKIIADALLQMQSLENDYKKLTSELSDKGENKQIIHAMITNLQMRISFLENVNTQIENIKQIKSNYNEKNTL